MNMQAPGSGKQCKTIEKMNHFVRTCNAKKVHAVTISDASDEERISLLV